MILCQTLDEAVALMSNPLGVNFAIPDDVDPEGTIIGSYKGEPVMVEGYSYREFYDIGCLKFFVTRRPFSHLEPFKDFVEYE